MSRRGRALRGGGVAIAAGLALLSGCGPDRAAAPAGPAAASAPGATKEAPPRAHQLGSEDALLARVQRPDPTTPRAIRIDRLGVDAVVVPVGVRVGTGELDVPPSTTDVAWYRYGATPGQDGSAVLAAHVDYDGRKGVFFRLTELAPGDEVAVTDARGEVRRFVVDSTRHVAKRSLSAEELFRDAGAPVLTLVTCGGDFDRRARSYRDNVIVQARPVP
jgi:LPXTG-site transpeptidase (sortase) family protein